MNRIINILLSTLAAATLLSCQKDEEGKNLGGDGNRIVFNMQIAGSRVATAADFTAAFQTGDQIGIYAVSRTSSAGVQQPYTGSYISNVKLTYNSVTDTWSPDSGVNLYYPANGNVLDFYAYYPYSASATDPSNIDFTVLADQSSAANFSASDLMSARNTGVAKSSNPVYLTFSHLLSLVQVTYNISTAGTAVTASLGGCMPSTTLDLGAAVGSQITTATGTATATGMLRVETSSSATTYTFRAIVPPQTIATGVNLVSVTDTGTTLQSPALTAAQTLTGGNASLYSVSPPLGAAYYIPIPAEFINAVYPDIGTYAGTRCYVVADPDDATKRIAEIDLEYIQGFSTTMPAIVVYGYTGGVRNDVGVIVTNGRKIDWSATTQGTAAPGSDNTTANYSSLITSTTIVAGGFDEFYYIPSDGAISFTAPSGAVTRIDPTAYYFTDWQNNSYSVAKIGRNQYYMTRNLVATTISSGATLSVANGSNWGESFGQYAYYNFNSANLSTYGLFYNMKAIAGSNMTTSSGWHVPSDPESSILQGYVTQANGTIYLSEYNIGAIEYTNVTGFSGILSSQLTYLSFAGASFGGSQGSSESGYWWTSTVAGKNYYRTIYPYPTGYFADPNFDHGYLGDDTYGNPVRLMVSALP